MSLTVPSTGSRRWVTVTDGSSNQIRHSQTPSGTWSNATSPFSTSGAFGIAYGNGIWVATGASGKVYTTTDPAGSWSVPASGGFGTATIYSVVYANGTWVAGYAASTGVRYATDPAGTWSAPASGGFTAVGVLGGVSHANGYWFAPVGNAASPNGMRYAVDAAGTWSSVTGPTSCYGRVVYANGTYVAIGDGPMLYYGTAASNLGSSAVPGAIGSVARGITYAAGYWVVGGTGKISYATSPDGSWSLAATPGFTGYVMWIEYIDGLFVAVGGSSSGALDIRTTTDPTGTWTAASSFTAGTAYGRQIALGGTVRQTSAIVQAITRASVI